MVHAVASSRPAIVKRSCTPPSGIELTLPFEFSMNGKRTSRTGPSELRNVGIEFVAP